MVPANVVPGVPNNDLSSKNGADEHGATIPPNQISTSPTIGKKYIQTEYGLFFEILICIDEQR